MSQRARHRAAALITRAVSQGSQAEQPYCSSTLIQPLRQAASTLAQQQPCSGLHLLPRLQLTQPLRPRALGGARHMLRICLPSTAGNASMTQCGSLLKGAAGFSSSTASSLLRSHRQLQCGRQGCWRSWMQQQAGASAPTNLRSSRALRGAFSTAAAPVRAAADAAIGSMRVPAWGAGVSSWFNNMPAAAAWWDSWSLWVNQHAAFMMATILNSLNLAGNKLPVALGLLLVDFVHNSPLLHGSRADALVLPSKLSESSFYAAVGPGAKAAAASSSSRSGGLAQLWRDVSSGAAAAWMELITGLSAGARLLWLGCIWLPALLTAPVMLWWDDGRPWWLWLMTCSLEASGPAFIKWGQWAATRHDLFAHDVCEALEKLHTQAPAHSFRYTCMALHKSFDLPPDQLFDWIEEAPIACGSIGQVHRAQLSEKGAALTCCDPGEVVAVKVRHPGVSDAIERDFQTMVWVAHIATQLFPSIRSLRLEDTLKQFAAPLHEQVDLSREAANLQRFNTNFRRTRSVSFPEPLYPLVSPDVLVESFEAGKHISVYITGQQGSDPYRARLAELGSGTMLQMMLVDNLIHSDLHPGNILVRLEQPHGLVGVAYKTVTALANPEGPCMQALGSALERLKAQWSRDNTSSADSSTDSSSSSSSAESAACAPVEVVAVEVLEVPAASAATAGDSTSTSSNDVSSTSAVTLGQQQGAAAAVTGNSSSSSLQSRTKGVRALVSQLHSAWSAGGPAALLQVLQSRLRGVAAGWLQPHIILLDVGMATELSPEDQTNMVGLFRAFAALDGRNVARWVLRFSGTDQACEDPQAFMEDMASTFETLKKTIAANEVARMRWEQQQQQQRKAGGQQQGAGASSADSSGSGVSSGSGSGLIEMPEQFDSGAEALSTVLELVRLHGVSLPGHIAGCVVTTLILEGWSNKLAPEHSVLSQVQSMFSPALLPWGSRIDSVVDTVMDRNDTALAMT